MDFPKNIKLIIFDFDGTLHNLSIDWQKMREVAGIASSNESLGDAIERLKKENQTQTLQKITQIEERSLAGEELNPSIKQTLQALQVKFKVAVLSRNSRLVIETFLKANGLNSLYVIGREDVDHLKPDPQGIYKILDHFKLSPAETILVGDTTHDVISAKNAGLKSVLVGSNYPDSAQPDYKISNLSELIVSNS